MGTRLSRSLSMSLTTRRDFLSASAAMAAGAASASVLSPGSFGAEDPPAISFGLVTYMWGADWDLPTLLKNCKKTGVLCVELRTTHAQKVEPDLDEAGREKVRNL